MPCEVKIMAERSIVSIGNQTFVIVDAATAFGADFPPEYRALLIQSTADDIATLMLIGGASGILVTTGTPTETRIAERKLGLEALGVSDVDAEVQAAVNRLKQLGTDALATRMMLFVS